MCLEKLILPHGEVGAGERQVLHAAEQGRLLLGVAPGQAVAELVAELVVGQLGEVTVGEVSSTLRRAPRDTERSASSSVSPSSMA